MTTEQYRAKAQYCYDCATRAITEQGRLAWTRIADNWIRMASQRESANLALAQADALRHYGEVKK